MKDNIEITDREFEQFADYIYEKSGIYLKESKKGLVRSRLRKRLRQLGLRSFQQYYDYVRRDQSGRELSRLIDAISTNVTSFFREPKHFDFLEENIIPRYIQKMQRQQGSYVHIWSSACSTGQEPYTIAISLLENIQKLAFYDIKVLGTDISRSAVETASRGIYPYKVVKNVDTQLVSRYFHTFTNDKGQRMVQVRKNVRDLVRLGLLNLNRKERWPFTKKFDLIFCRNVMIYFDPPVVERLINRFYRYMKDGGYLFIGHSESLTRIKHKFKYVKATVYQK